MRTLNAVASRKYKFAALLALLLVALAAQSFEGRAGVERTLSDAFRTMLALAILVVVFERQRERVAMAMIVAGAIAIAWGRRVSGANLDTAMSITLSALLSLFMWAAVWVILRELFRKPAVGAEDVLGAICGYLIAGEGWASVNEIAYLAIPAAYSINPDVTTPVSRLPWGRLVVDQSKQASGARTPRRRRRLKCCGYLTTARPKHDLL